MCAVPRAILFAFSAIILLTAVFSALAEEAESVARSSASAVTAGGSPVLYAETSSGAAPFQRDFDGGYSQGGVSIGYIAVEGDADAVSARARVSASGLSLVNGRVTIDAISMAVSAGDAGTGVTEAAVSGLVVDGNPVSAGPGTRLLLAGYGTVLLFEQYSPTSGEIRANAVRLEPDGSGSSGGGAGSVGNLAAAAPASAPEPETAPLPAPAPASPQPEPPAESPSEPEPELAPPVATPADEAPEPAAAPVDPPESSTELAAPVPTDAAGEENGSASGLAPAVVPRIGLPVQPVPDSVGEVSDFEGYVFPVFGDNVSYSDTYGAPRAVTVWHKGTDLFAPTGTPLLAVADGELFLVGTNRLGGNRLWLRDDAGNEFYYAHLSAFSPLAVDGARVRAGDVVGFLGNSGDAITTPPHLHFEVHPGGLDSVNPYPYLLAWQRRTDLPRAFREAAVAVGPAPAAGALIIEVTPDRDAAPKSESGLATPVS